MLIKRPTSISYLYVRCRPGVTPGDGYLRAWMLSTHYSRITAYGLRISEIGNVWVLNPPYEPVATTFGDEGNRCIGGRGFHFLRDRPAALQHAGTSILQHQVSNITYQALTLSRASCSAPNALSISSSVKNTEVRNLRTVLCVQFTNTCFCRQ